VKNPFTLRSIPFLEWNYIKSFCVCTPCQIEKKGAKARGLKQECLRTMVLRYRIIFPYISKLLKYPVRFRILNSIVIFLSTIFIFDSLSIKVEKRRLSVFALSWKGKLTASVQVHQREAFTFPLWIIYSDSEYGLLLPIQIPDSYTLNVTVNETLASQNSRVGKGGIIW